MFVTGCGEPRTAPLNYAMRTGRPNGARSSQEPTHARPMDPSHVESERLSHALRRAGPRLSAGLFAWLAPDLVRKAENYSIRGETLRRHRPGSARLGRQRMSRHRL